MVRHAADRRLILALALLGAASGCADDTTTTFEITSPNGLGQFVPGGTLEIDWTVSGPFDPAKVEVELRSREGGGSYTIAQQGVGDVKVHDTGFTWAGLDTDRQTVPLGYYDLWVSMGAPLADQGDTHVVVVQGLAFTTPKASDPPLTVSQASPASLMFTTSTIGTLDVEMFALEGATQTPIHTMTVPGELHSVARELTWDGTDATGAPLPSGTYVIGANVTDQASAATYQTTGGDVVIP